MHNILCTGCCGFIGSNVIDYLCNKYKDKNFYNLDKLDYCSRFSNFINYKNYNFIYGNICDISLINYILNTYKIDTIIHFAAQTHVDNSFGNSLEFTKDNVLGTHTLLEACKHYGNIDKFLHISTDEVYGEVDNEHSGCCEKSLLNPTNPYSATKAAAEFICKSYYSSFKLPIIITRANNVYGPGQYPEKLIPKFIQHLLNNEKCTVHGNGDTRRNFIHVYDIATAIDIILNKGEINEVYNIGTNNEYSVMDILIKLSSMLQPNSKLEDLYINVEDRHFNDFRYAINCEKLKSLGWNESIDFEEGFKNTVNWYVKNIKEKNWINK